VAEQQVISHFGEGRAMLDNLANFEEALKGCALRAGGLSEARERPLAPQHRII